MLRNGAISSATVDGRDSGYLRNSGSEGRRRGRFCTGARMVEETSERRERLLGRKRLFRRLPPTAVPVTGSDLWRGLAAILERQSALEQFRSVLMARRC